MACLKHLASSSPQRPPRPVEPTEILSAAYAFSRTVHNAPADAFYRAFVPELGAVLLPQRVELAKRCQRIQLGEPDFVGATVFPGLVKVLNAAALKDEGQPEGQVVVKRAVVACECSLGIQRGALVASKATRVTPGSMQMGELLMGVNPGSVLQQPMQSQLLLHPSPLVQPMQGYPYPQAQAQAQPQYGQLPQY